MMHRRLLFICSAMMFTSGCTALSTAPARVPPGPEQSPAPTTSRPAPASSEPPIAVPPSTVATPPTAGTAPSAGTPTVVAAATTAPKPRPKISKPPVDKLPPVDKSPPASAPTASQAPLDLTSLQQRLRDTRAIGVFTKLSLKNQVDDLLDEFRALYKQPNSRPTAQMREHFDLLLLKVLTLLQDGDPVLAAAISSSKEAIWGILADPDKFSKI